LYDDLTKEVYFNNLPFLTQAYNKLLSNNTFMHFGSLHKKKLKNINREEKTQNFGKKKQE